jgi:erythrocyte band 7 integral membrane protein
LGAYTISEMLSGREQISKQIQSTLDHITHEWGIKIERFELKNIHLPTKLKQSLAAQTEANQDSQVNPTNSLHIKF